MDEWLNPEHKKEYEKVWIDGKHLYKPYKRKKRKKVISALIKLRCDYCKKIIYRKPSQVKYYKYHFCTTFHHDLFRRNRKIVQINKSKLQKHYLYGKGEANKKIENR